jgi:hypothetical protein
MRKILISAVAAVLILGACGDDGGGPDPADDPKGALSNALEQFNNYEGVTMTMSVDSDTGSLVALSEGSLSDEQADQILDSSVTITSKSSEDPADSQAEIIANIAGNDSAVEMKFVDATLYARADVAGLMETFGADSSQLETFEQQASGQPGFEFVGPALDGEWIAMTGFDQALQQFGGTTASEPTEAQKEAIASFTAALEDAADVESGDLEGPGDHIVASVQLREIYDSFTELAGQLGTAGGAPIPSASEVPDETLRLDTWVEDGRLTQVSLDFKQFAEFEGADPIPEGAEKLALVLGFEEFTGDVEAPDDVTEVDLSQVMQGFLGGMGTGTAPGGDVGTGDVGTDALCEELAVQLEGQPQEVVDQLVAQYGDQCPDLGT